MLVRLTIGCARVLIVVSGQLESGGCALCSGSGVASSTSSCILELFCALEGVVLGCGCNGEGVTKGTKHSGSHLVLGRASTVAVVGGATV